MTRQQASSPLPAIALGLVGAALALTVYAVALLVFP